MVCNIFCVRAIPKGTIITTHYLIHCITIVIHFAIDVNLSFDVEYIYGFLWWGVCKQSRWRHCVTEPSQDGGYVLLWQRYDNNKMVAMRYYVLRLQQYSHRLNLCFFQQFRQFHVIARVENCQFSCKYKLLRTLLVVWLFPTLSTKFPIVTRSWNWSVGQFLYLSPTDHNGTEIVSVEEPEIDRPAANRLRRYDTRQTATDHS